MLPTALLPFLYNPLAGRGTAGRRIREVVKVFERAGVAVEPLASAGAGDIERLAREKSDAGCERLLVAGGDGSIHEAVNGLLASRTPAALGVIALGTGNDFAKANAISRHPVTAAELLSDRLANGLAPRAVDVGRLNGRYFANGAGLGFDAQVAATAASMRFAAGPPIYLLALLKVLAAGVATPRMTLTVDGDTIDGRLTLASFSIGPSAGGMFPIAPMAKNDDGLLDLVYADALSRGQILRLLPKLLEGRHIGRPGVHHRTLTGCRLRTEQALAAHLDGELLEPQNEFVIELVPAALSLL